MDMSVFLYRLCEVLIPNIVASWLSSGRLLIISVTGKVLCKDTYIYIYTVLKLKQAVLHLEKNLKTPQTEIKVTNVSSVMMIAPPLLLITPKIHGGMPVSICF